MKNLIKLLPIGVTLVMLTLVSCKKDIVETDVKYKTNQTYDSTNTQDDNKDTTVVIDNNTSDTTSNQNTTTDSTNSNNNGSGNSNSGGKTTTDSSYVSWNDSL